MKLHQLFEAVIKPDPDILRDIHSKIKNALPYESWNPALAEAGTEDFVLRVLLVPALEDYMNLDILKDSTPSTNPLMRKVGISSLVYSGISDDLPDITIVLHSEDFQKALHDSDMYDEFINVLMMGIEHELIHFEQDKKSAGTMNPENVSFDSNAEYLSNKHEMMAHANDAVKILLSKYDRRKAIQMVSSESIWEEDIFRIYKETFSGTEQEKSVLRRFLKYCYEYLTN